MSITLTNAHTTTEVAYQPSPSGRTEVDFLFEGRHRPDFSERIERYVGVLTRHFPVLTGYQYTIRSDNSFPHSTGIASSASAMSAMALCFASIAGRLGQALPEAEFWRVVSHLARLGSGSACRSVLGPVAVWGETPAVPGSSDHHAVALPRVHELFQSMRDTILIVDHGPKAVSSSDGHALMHGHPYAQTRFAQAGQNLQELVPVMESGDMERFIALTEHEALSLHAMMMTSSPGYVLVKPGTLDIIEKVRVAREEDQLPVCFTLDAGPNVHLLYPEAVEETAKAWIEAELKQHCHEGQIIHDRSGSGPVQLEAG